MRRFAALLALAAIYALSPAQAAGFKWAFAEFQPTVPEGGRANTIAPNPGDPRTIAVASESGGLFLSTDSGVHWRHLDGLHEYMTMGVAWVPPVPAAKASNVLLATALADFHSVNGGGIWRSTDGGTSWTHVHGSSDAGFGAGEIAFAPDENAIYIATSSGIVQSTDEGKTWTSCGSPLSTTRVQDVSIAAIDNHVLLASGHGGGRPQSQVLKLLQCTDTWNPSGSAAFFEATSKGHALSTVPGRPFLAYYANDAGELWASEKAGSPDFWQLVHKATNPSSRCGGIPFARLRAAPPGETGFRLYHGDGCDLYSATATLGADDKLVYDGNWIMSDESHIWHRDTRDIAFQPEPYNMPWLLASDGGLALFKNMNLDGTLEWRPIGGGAAGYDALQITEVRHQKIDAVLRAKNKLGEIDLYFGTHDNHFHASTDNGLSWRVETENEGAYIQAEPAIPNERHAHVTFRRDLAYPYSNMLAERALAKEILWPNAFGDDRMAPVIAGDSHYFQSYLASDGSYAIAETRDLGAHWTTYAKLPAAPADTARLGWTALQAEPVLYVPIRIDWDTVPKAEVHSLVRIERTSAGASVRYPLMSALPPVGISSPAASPFGSLAQNREHYNPREVFAVDPGDPYHLFAPDLANHEMKETKDGGDFWIPRPDMTALVTQNGEFLFDDNRYLSVGAIEFNPLDANMVALGARDAGVFVSRNRGVSWEKMPGSERATFVSSIEWIDYDDLIVSTQGRGLWRAHLYFEPPPRFICPRCDFSPRELERGAEPVPDPSEIKTLDHTLVVLNGTLQGARMEAGRLVEIFITPGATIGWRSISGSSPPAVQITHSSRKRGYTGGRFVTSTRRSRSFAGVGLVIGRDGQVRGLVSSRRPLTLASARPQEKLARNVQTVHLRAVGTDHSPIVGKPYLHIVGVDPRMVMPGAPLSLSLSGVEAGFEAEVLIDGHPVEHAKADDKRVIAIKFPAPRQEGRHAIEVKDTRTGRIVDGLNVVVVATDTVSGVQKRTL